MNTEIKIGIALAICTLVIGAVSLYTIIWAIKNKYFVKLKLQWDKNNFLPILSAGIVISTCILLSGIIPSISNIFKLYFRPDNIVGEMDVLKFLSLCLIACSILLLLTNFIARTLCNALLGEMAMMLKEDDQNKLKYYSIVFSSIFIGFSFLLKDVVFQFAEFLVPYTRFI
jgi:hypothetical protein